MVAAIDVNDVEFVDFLTLANNFGNPVASYADGNVDLQNGVDFSDFLLMASNFGASRDVVATVPEPGCSASIVLIAAVYLLITRRP